MNLEHKGYRGTLDYSVEDGCYLGSLLSVNGTINYEGDTLIELKQNFQVAVDDYLLFCGKNKISPKLSPLSVK